MMNTTADPQPVDSRKQTQAKGSRCNAELPPKAFAFSILECEKAEEEGGQDHREQQLDLDNGSRRKAEEGGQPG